jgi:hypothetical protein
MLTLCDFVKALQVCHFLPDMLSDLKSGAEPTFDFPHRDSQLSSLYGAARRVLPVRVK